MSWSTKYGFVGPFSFNPIQTIAESGNFETSYKPYFIKFIKINFY